MGTRQEKKKKNLNEISKIIQPSTLYHNVNDRNIVTFIISK